MVSEKRPPLPSTIRLYDKDGVEENHASDVVGRISRYAIEWYLLEFTAAYRLTNDTMVVFGIFHMSNGDVVESYVDCRDLEEYR